ncbi:MAG: hypothetical protein H0W84_14540 [Bacteroidetes bacterium]|nr:hypothetical protein [Bacteroidota bacterium]
MITTETKTKHIDQLRVEHQLWASAIELYTDELKIFQNWLEEIAVKNMSIEVRKQIEHFQNQFIIQKEQLDILNHETNIHEQWLAELAKENPSTIDRKTFADYKGMRDQMKTSIKFLLSLKTNLRNFYVNGCESLNQNQNLN